MRPMRLTWLVLVMIVCFGLLVALATPVFASKPVPEQFPAEEVYIPDSKPDPSASSVSDFEVSSLRSVSGEANLIKVFPSYQTTFVYLQCGHVVAKVVPYGCGKRAGNWRYTTSCQKSDTIYVTIPCW